MVGAKHQMELACVARLQNTVSIATKITLVAFSANMVGAKHKMEVACVARLQNTVSSATKITLVAFSANMLMGWMKRVRARHVHQDAISVTRIIKIAPSAVEGLVSMALEAAGHAQQIVMNLMAVEKVIRFVLK